MKETVKHSPLSRSGKEGYGRLRTEWIHRFLAMDKREETSGSNNSICESTEALENA